MTAPLRTASVARAMTPDPVRSPARSGPGPGAQRGEMAGMDQGMRVLSYLIAGVLLYGALGWLGDRLFGTGFLLPVGIVLGAAAGCYTIIRRYGQHAEVTGIVPGQPGSGAAQRSAQPHSTTHDDTTEVAR